MRESARIYGVRVAQFVLKLEKLSHIIGARESRDLRSPSPIMAPGFIALSIVQSVAPPKTGKIRAEIICLRVDLLALGVIHACEWPLKNPTNVFIHRFQGIFNANVFSELAVHTESKMIIFTSGPLRGFTFSGKFCTQSTTRRAGPQMI